ncbi:MAG: hypothetical protein ABWY52_00615 [Candidatus Limnocylindrales bacterium]
MEANFAAESVVSGAPPFRSDADPERGWLADHPLARRRATRDLQWFCLSPSPVVNGTNHVDEVELDAGIIVDGR